MVCRTALIIVYQPKREESRCLILYLVGWPTPVFMAVTTFLKKDVDRASLGWCGQVVKKTLTSLLGGTIKGNGYEISWREG